jgi:hypothetical protein
MARFANPLPNFPRKIQGLQSYLLVQVWAYAKGEYVQEM